MKKINQKKILEYSAIFEPAEEGGYNVSFPSFPGCVTFGKNFEQAKVKAQEVLELWLEELASNGAKIPAIKYRPIIDEVRVNIPPKAKIAYASNNC
ncbi:MAG: type II toxin-antitoxin system HicB family antitoxin [bacterium]|nr:type II toxin-antitoxin system HicB family antitoxin [bacterium]